MTPTDSRRFGRHVTTISARLDFGLPCATLLRKQSRKSGRKERYKRVMFVTEPRSEDGVRFKKPRPLPGAWKQNPLSVHACRALGRLPRKRKKPRHGQFEYSVPARMLVRYKMRRHAAEISVSKDFERNSRLQPAFPHDTL